MMAMITMAMMTTTMMSSHFEKNFDRVVAVAYRGVKVLGWKSKK